MEKGTEISVVIPLHNVEAHIAKAAESLAAQAFDGLEAVLVDDGSSDGSLEAMRRLLGGGIAGTNGVNGTNGIKIITVSQSNKGPGGARNAGILAAAGEYVMFLDADDFLLPGALRDIRDALRNRPDVLFGGYRRYIEGIGLMKEKQPGAPKKARAGGLTERMVADPSESSWNSAWRYVCRRGFLIENGLFFAESLYCEDMKWALELLLALERAGGDFAALAAPFYAYNYRRPGSIMNSRNPKRLIDLAQIVKEALPQYAGRPAVRRELVWQAFYYINEYGYLLH